MSVLRILGLLTPIGLASEVAGLFTEGIVKTFGGEDASDEAERAGSAVRTAGSIMDGVANAEDLARRPK